MLLWWACSGTGASVLIVSSIDDETERKLYIFNSLNLCVFQLPEHPHMHATAEVLRALYSARTRRRAHESQHAVRFQMYALPPVLARGWQMQRDAVHRESYATIATRARSPPQSTILNGNFRHEDVVNGDGVVRTASPTTMITWSFHASSATPMPPASALSDVACW